MNLPFPFARRDCPAPQGQANPTRANRELTPRSPRPTPHASRLTHHASRITPQSGVALVITLILLAVITFMAVTFLVLSRAQRGVVTTTTEQATAKYTTDIAQQQAIAEVMASIIAFTNEFNYGSRVSTNYIRSAGFVTGVSSPTNVSYNYANGGPVTGNDAYQNLQNLLYLPRVPVWVTNRAGGSNELRFYLDLNRNQRFETNGLLPVMNPTGGFYDLAGRPIASPIAFNTLSNFFVGDPEWIGVLERPELPHSPTNRFIARYAYFVVPAGKTLDLNAIHNFAKNGPGSPFKNNMTAILGDGFFRNQGVGPWEINLAAFLVDLNTNYWPYPLDTTFNGVFGTAYYYDTNSAPFTANKGTAFDDAFSLVRYRYAANALSLASVNGLFPNRPVASDAFTHNFVDDYCRGPLMTGISWPPAPASTLPPDPDNTRLNLPWPGAENTNHYFNTQELFDKAKSAVAVKAGVMPFPDRLLAAGTNLDSYNRYSFYRFWDQMGTDSAPDKNKINLNYANVDAQGHVVPNLATNFIDWTPVQFFTNVATRLLANAGYSTGPAYTGVGNLINLLATNNLGNTNFQIQVWPTNFYTPSVHRLLQLAANIYDATTNRGTQYPYYPSVFWPTFNRLGTNVFINGFREATNADEVLAAATLDPFKPSDRAQIKPGLPVMLYGVPMVVGAKKGFPNFNEYLMQTHLRLTRKLEFRRPKPELDVNETNVMYVLSVTNAYGLEAWNSYQSNYVRGLKCIAVANMMAVVTNTVVTNMVDPPALAQFQWNYNVFFGPTNVSPWPGYYPGRGQSFLIPFAATIPLFTNHCCFDTNGFFQQVGRVHPGGTMFEENGRSFPIPPWWLNLRTRVRFILVDTAANHIVDYVNLDSQDLLDLAYVPMQDAPGHPIIAPTDSLGRELEQGGQNPVVPDAGYWITYRYGQNAVAIANRTNRNYLNTDITLPTYGIMNQILTSMGLYKPKTMSGTWNDMAGQPISASDTSQATTSFMNQFVPLAPGASTAGRTNIFYAPYAPSRDIYYLTTWEANDPLVHYTVDDLVALDSANQTNRFQFVPGKQYSSSDILTNIGLAANDRYDPWPTTSGAKATNYNVFLKDPQLRAGPLNFVGSDSWDFPTNKFPNIGWLGRVHRGTPWQTVYLKAGAADPPTWIRWTGNGRQYLNVGQLQTNIAPVYNPLASGNFAVADAMLTHPTNDYYILDLFTTSISDSAARGKMSINQSSLAAWSALLSGVAVLTNAALPNGNYVPIPAIIQPAGVYDPFNTNTWPPVVRLVTGINRTRTNLFLNSRGVFDRLGDFLKVPELTVNSPFFNFNTNTLNSPKNVVNDAVMERLPQQILGLLQNDQGPRFIVYAFGQALKPADRSIVTTGPFFGLCTNYQVVAEAATRSVVRIDGVPFFQPPAPLLLSPQTLQFAAPLIVRPAFTNLTAVIEQFNPLPPD